MKKQANEKNDDNDSDSHCEWKYVEIMTSVKRQRQRKLKSDKKIKKICALKTNNSNKEFRVKKK